MEREPLVNPAPSSPATTRSMKGNVAKGTGPEIELRRLLRELGFGGYRLHWKVAGRPDIAYPGRKIAVFVNGCFWHRCPHCQPSTPKSHTEFWSEKFRRNQERDERKRQELADTGWQVFTVWECRLRDAPDEELSTLLDALRAADRH